MKAARAVMRVLNVAEKNDAAKHIAGHLARGAARRREGLSQYNKIYEFEAEVEGRRCQMAMTSVSGHLLNYEFVGNYKIWQSCDPRSLFDAPVAKTCPKDYEKIKQTLIREVRTCQGLIIWTDCDREGENIGYEIIQVCTEIKPDLKVFRAKFSEITGPSVQRALQNLERPNKNISDAVDVRQELDLRIGAAFTRFQTLRLQRVFPEKLADSLVSYGSCQFPTLGFVVERYRAVENFIPESFWKICVTHTMDNLTVDFNWKRNRLFDEQACMVIHDICKENPTATVQSVKSKPKSKWRPLPLDTVEFEKLSSRKLRINAKEAMRIAEKLYTQGIISYPRTETNIYPKELNLTNLVSLQIGSQEWGPFAQRILDSGGPNPRQGKKTDQAHPPIHPTKHVDNLSGPDKKVYELVVRSFLACCSKDAQGHETTVEIDIAGEKFSANGLVILERNYLDVYPYDKWTGKEIHAYQDGQTFQPTTLNMVGGQTSAPALLTEADLIALMEKHGIGTDATHAEHIETIKKRSYVGLSDNIHFVPGLLGMGLVDGYDDMGLAISKPNLRAGLEADLKLICEGRKAPREVLSQQINIYRDIYIRIAQEAQKIDEALSKRFNQPPQAQITAPTFNQSVLKCSKCRSDMTLRAKKDNQGYFISCMGYPQCKNAIWLPSFVDKVTATQQTCEICGPSAYKLEFHWKNRSLAHLYPAPYIGCVGGCDPQFLQALGINSSSNRTSHDSGIGSTISSSSIDLTRNTSNDWFNGENPSRSMPNNSSQHRNTTNWTSSENPSRPTSNNSSQHRNASNNWFNNDNSGPGQSSFNSGNIVSHSTQNAVRANDDDVMCNCGEPALKLTVRKATPNMGKQFYKCARQSNNCNFFLWANESSENTNSVANTQRPVVPTNSASNWDAPNTSNGWNNDNVPMCRCNLPAKKLTVFKEGPNKGRPFYGCSNAVTSRCNFFEWADDQSGVSNDASTSWGSESSSRGRGRGRGASRPSGERAKKRCGNCREEGHTRNKCPRLE